MSRAPARFLEAAVEVTVLAENQPPRATITSPADGSGVTEGTRVMLSGAASDPEDGDLPGGVLSWTLDGTTLLGSGASLPLPSVPPGPHRVTLTAVDRQGLAAYASIAFTVYPVGANQPPVVSITRPTTGSRLTAGQSVTLEGSATDTEDGTLSGGSLTWKSNRDGVLGTGALLPGVLLTQGVHTLTLEATDTTGATTRAEVIVAINPAANAAPTVTITRPASGSAFFAGTAITFEATATDPESGTLSGTALRWSSSLGGDLGTGASLTLSTLAVGSHRVTVLATDPGGSVGVARVSLEVLAPNQPPTVRITAPADGASFTAGTSIAFRGSATDFEDGPLTGGHLVWSSSLQGELGQGASLDFASLRAGNHRITLTARDSAGQAASDSLRLTIHPGAGNLPPVARLSGPGTGEAGVELTFSGADSSDPEGRLASYHFDFGDGTSAVIGTASQVTHTFAAAGRYTVVLTVRDAELLSASATLTVDVTPAVRRPQVVSSGHDVLGGRCEVALAGDGSFRAGKLMLY